jgi:hypothetical protein
MSGQADSSPAQREGIGQGRLPAQVQGATILPSQALLLPPGLPVCWRPSLVLTRLKQALRWAHGPGGRSRSYTPPRAMVQGYRERLGILQSSIHGLVVCECRCGRRAAALWLSPSTARWHCLACRPEGAPEGFVARIAAYAFGQQIGARGWSVNVRRRSLEQATLERARVARTAAELWLVTQATGVLTRPRPKRAIIRHQLPSGGRATTRTPLWGTLAPGVADALVDTLLDREAYRQRYGLEGAGL